MKSKLIQAINSVNNRYAKGLNDDDQVARMVNQDKNTKGFSFFPLYDSYELVTDEEKIRRYVNKHGYWSEQVLQFNGVLAIKGGAEYMRKLNEPYTGTNNGITF